MKELQRLRSQLSSADYHHVTVLILGMLTMLVGEFSTALPIAEILRNFNSGGTTVQLVNILPLAILALMYPLGPVWLQKRTVTTLFRDSLKSFYYWNGHHWTGLHVAPHVSGQDYSGGRLRNDATDVCHLG